MKELGKGGRGSGDRALAVRFFFIAEPTIAIVCGHATAAIMFGDNNIHIFSGRGEWEKGRRGGERPSWFCVRRGGQSDLVDSMGHGLGKLKYKVYSWRDLIK